MLRTSCWLGVFAVVLTGYSGSSVSAGDPVALFDGKSLEGWTVINCKAVVQDGAILLESGNGVVQSQQRYGDFVLEFEWKSLKSDDWDSGVYFRYADIPQDHPWPDEYQVNLRKGEEGNLVGFADGKNRASIKPGEWNRFELTVKGSVASLKVNQKEAWKVDGIKVPNGYIALQAEIPGGGQFLFRKIRITQLGD